MSTQYYILFAYIAAVNIVAAFLTLHDKKAAKRHSWRVKENTLLLVAAAGGSVAMFLTMKAIRHKTQHWKFMIGIPVIMVLQAVVMIFIFVKK